MKVCSKCREQKPLAEFSRNRGECKKCAAKYAADWYLQNKERCKENMRVAAWSRLSTVEGRIRELIRSAAQRAKLKKLPFELDEVWLRGLWDEQDGCCKLTGLRFDLSRGPARGAAARRRYHQLAPSLDRIDSDKGYTKDNVELVCWHINLAFGQWGRSAFNQVAKAYVERLS